MAEEIEDARRTVPRAVLVAAVVITLLYLAGTFSILVAIPHGAGLGPAGNHAGRSGDGGESQRRLAGADTGGHDRAQFARRRGGLVRGRRAAAVRGRD